jgi:Mg-chelatase subunit ChlD
MRTDAVLVIDASSSMTGDKLEAAKTAARAFLAAVPVPQNQIGIVTFHRTAAIASRLTGDAGALDRAVGGIQVAPGTHIDAGLDEAKTVLAGPERVVSHVAVVVLLTDGIQEHDPERPLAIASTLRGEGVELFVVGLGADVDVSYLELLAGRRDRVFLSPLASDLAAIYAGLARLIPCPAEAYWGGR